jgi:hypothetical protein
VPKKDEWPVVKLARERKEFVNKVAVLSEERILDLIGKNYFPKGAKILAIHTGGIQGIKGMNIYLKKKNLQQIITQ